MRYKISFSCVTWQASSPLLARTPPHCPCLVSLQGGGMGEAWEEGLVWVGPRRESVLGWGWGSHHFTCTYKTGLPGNRNGKRCNTSWICMPSLHRGWADLCTIPIYSMCCCTELVSRTLWIYCLSNLQIWATVLALVTVPYIASSGLSDSITRNLYLWLPSAILPRPRPLPLAVASVFSMSSLWLLLSFSMPHKHKIIWHLFFSVWLSIMPIKVHPCCPSG